MRRRALAVLLLPCAWACRQEAPPPPAPRAESPQDKDRRELVLQSRRDWKPLDAPRKLELQLIAEKNSITSSQRVRCRLELKNAGREPVIVREPEPSFIKGGSLCGRSLARFYAAAPGAAERRLPCEPTTAPPSDPKGVELTLQPGEYLLTRGDGPSNRFRDLRTGFRFDRPGVYRLRAVYAAPGLFVESNSVSVTVSR